MPSYHFYIKKKFNLKYRNAKIYISETHVNNITLTKIYIYIYIYRNAQGTP